MDLVITLHNSDYADRHGSETGIVVSNIYCYHDVVYKNEAACKINLPSGIVLYVKESATQITDLIQKARIDAFNLLQQTFYPPTTVSYDGTSLKPENQYGTFCENRSTAL